jgi:ribosomal protein L22
MNLDPDPHARRKVERKLVIQGVKRHGRMTKAQTIARTERESLYKSQNLPTSTKKMQKVVNQLAGKTVSEALVQLRFSPKRIARDVIKGLEIAQNEAIVGRGMGLGGGHRAQKRWEAQRARSDLPRSTRALVEKPNHDLNPGPAKIELKDGSKKIVSDPSEIYIDQVWVGKGEMWMSPEYRARGAVNMLRHRTTSKSIFAIFWRTRGVAKTN